MNFSLHRMRSAWFNWVNSSVNRKIFSAAITVGVMSVLVKAVGFAKELIIAYQFGVSDALGAFFIAWLLPASLADMSARASKTALIPTYFDELENTGRDAAYDLVANTIAWSLTLMLGVVVLLVLLAPMILPLMASGFSSDKLALTHLLFLILLITVVVKGLSSIWDAVLNANDRFMLVSLSPAIISLATIITLLVLGDRWGIFALPAGLVVGFGLEAIVLARELHRIGIPLRLCWPRLNPPMKQVMVLFIPSIATAFMMGCTSLIDQSMAGMLGPKSVATLAYGNRLILVVLSMGGLALNTASMPFITRMVAKHQWADLRHTLRTYLGLVALVTIPMTLMFVLFSEPITTLLFQRGAFTAESTQQVAEIQVMYALQIPFYIASSLMSRVIVAMKMHRLLSFISGASLIVNIALNLLFMQIFGLKGIALSTSVVYLGIWLMSTVVAYRGMRKQIYA